MPIFIKKDDSRFVCSSAEYAFVALHPSFMTLNLRIPPRAAAVIIKRTVALWEQNKTVKVMLGVSVVVRALHARSEATDSCCSRPGS